MTRAAIADPDPCILVEARELYQVAGDVYLDEPPERVRGARFVREGDALSIITWGPMVQRALAAAENLASDGIEISVLDLRWLRPLDDVAIARAVQLGRGSVLVAHEANMTGGFGAEIVARLHEHNETGVALRVRRVAAPDIRVPAAPNLQHALLPHAFALEQGCRKLLASTTPVTVT